MELLIWLLAAHFLGDFYLQPIGWVSCRNQNHYKSKGLWQHVAVHTLLNIIVFSATNENSIVPSVIAIMVISSAHLITDIWKSYQPATLSYFVIDQTIHLFIILAVWVTLSNISIEQLRQTIGNLLTIKNLVIAVAYLLVCKPASIVISLALEKHTPKLRNANSGLARAGTWIGYLERCLTISFIFMNQFAGIGFLVTTKTIFRFGDLRKNKDMKLTEYMLLGTLLSYSIAIFIGWNGLAIYRSAP